MSAFEDVVLIGDPNKERFNWLKKFLADEYSLEAEHSETFYEIKKVASDKSRNLNVRMILLTDDLPYSNNSPESNPLVNFAKLEEHFFGPVFVCIVTKDVDPNFNGIDKHPTHIHLRVFPPNSEDTKEIKSQLRTLGTQMPTPIAISEIAKIADWDRDNRILRRQIRALSERNELADGETHLLRLIGKSINCAEATKIEIRQLGQGKSGSNVFRVIKLAPRNEEYLLKVGKSDILWKLEAEVRGHLEAKENTDLPGYKVHIAKLREPFYLREPQGLEHRFVVNSGQWYAIHYDFLGGPSFGKFMDLESALILAPTTLIEVTKNTNFALDSTEPDRVLAHRLKIFRTVLEGLSEIWYEKKELSDRIPHTIWRTDDAKDRTFIPLPPYQLTGRIKDFVQDFIDAHDTDGRRRFPNWDRYRDYVLSLVSDENVSVQLKKKLGQNIPFTLSPVHGDLNANNVLLWLEHDKYPFLIDLPFYQKNGHSLQDFARLEVEVKMGLMDRQEESPVTMDTDTQIPLWIEMEDRLMDKRALNKAELVQFQLATYNWRAAGFTDNVTLCYHAVLLIREKACMVQQKILDGKPLAEPFATEYLPALLYHTIRSISYTSLPVFKRLLAVYSSGLILERIMA